MVSPEMFRVSQLSPRYRVQKWTTDIHTRSICNYCSFSSTINSHDTAVSPGITRIGSNVEITLYSVWWAIFWFFFFFLRFTVPAVHARADTLAASRKSGHGGTSRGRGLFAVADIVTRTRATGFFDEGEVGDHSPRLARGSARRSRAQFCRESRRSGRNPATGDVRTRKLLPPASGTRRGLLSAFAPANTVFAVIVERAGERRRTNEPTALRNRRDAGEEKRFFAAAAAAKRNKKRLIKKIKIEFFLNVDLSGLYLEIQRHGGKEKQGKELI